MPTTYQVQVSHDARPPAGRGASPQALAGDSVARHGSRPWAGPALMFGGALSNQTGAATGALGVRRDRPGGRRRDPPVDCRDRATGRRAAPVALVHRDAVAPGAAARGGL